MRFKSLSTKFTKKHNLKAGELSFITLKDEVNSMVLNSNFNQHNLYVKHHLNQVKRSWEASVHPDFSNMSIKQLNKFAGIQRNNINRIVKNFMSFKYYFNYI